MVLALSATLIVIVALIWEVGWPGVSEWLDRRRAGRERIPAPDYDPGREQRAENRARQLLRSCVSEEEWEMYRDLGFIRVWGGLPQGADDRPAAGGASYAYLVYPHRPLLAYLPQTRELLGEYCVDFPDETRPYGSDRLPDSADVLARWMALTADERRLLASSNLHVAGRQVDPRRATRDLWRLEEWERRRMRRAGGESPAADTLPTR